MPGRTRPFIACVSTQLCCAVRCEFCATRESGLIRQLSSQEISAQIDAVVELAIADGARPSQIEISFMGMGEPLANAKALTDAIRATHSTFPDISRVSVSTVGPADRVRAFASSVQDLPVPVHLQLSLHATRDEHRRLLVPGTNDTIASLVDAGQFFAKTTSDHVCLNYVLLDGFNDSDDDAARLSAFDPRSFYIKLTHLNFQANLPAWVRPATQERFAAFVERLSAAGVPFKIFKGDGLDINASCGQLAARPVELFRSDFARTG